MSDNIPNAQPQPNFGQPAPMSPADQRLWATLTHVGGIFFSFVPSLVAYLVLKDRGGFIRAHSATALNFQLTMLITYLVGGILTLIVVGYLLVIAAGVLTLIFSIIAGVKANNGELYKYPLSIPFFS